MSMLYDDYAADVREFKKIYGERLLVVYEVGSFYEWYNCDRDAGCDVRGICDLLNVQHTRRDKRVLTISRENPAMGGVPKAAFAKYVPVLTAHDFTIVIVSQFGAPPKITRKVTEVISRGTSGVFEDWDTSDPAGNYVMGVFVDGVSHRDASSQSRATSVPTVHAGCAFVDLGTGKSFAYEINSSREDPEFALDDLHRLTRMYCPQEVVVYGSASALQACDDHGLVVPFCRRVGVRPAAVRDRTDGEQSRQISTIRHQEHVLRKIFPDTGFLTAVEALDLEARPHACAAFSGLLHFLFEHSESVVQGLQRPTVETIDGEAADDSRRRVILSYNAADQLDLVVSSSQSSQSRVSLCGVLNKCVTAMGRRYFRQQLLTPLTDATAITDRLAVVDGLTKSGAWREGRSMLTKVGDLERVFRRLVMQRIEPGDFVGLDASLEALGTEAPSLVGADDLGAKASTLAVELRSRYSDVLDVECLRTATTATTVWSAMFRRQVYPDLDAMRDEHREVMHVLELVVDALNAAQGNGHFRLTSTPDAGNGGSGGGCCHYRVTGTPTRCAALMKTARARTKILWHGSPHEFHFSALNCRAVVKDCSEVTHPVIDDGCKRLHEVEERLFPVLRNRYAEFVGHLSIVTRDTCQALTLVTQRLDYACACAHNAHTFRHEKPEIVSTTSTGGGAHLSGGGGPGSFLSARQVRHPILEATLHHIPLVPNDVSVGCSGVLLYGMNASGKSCLMKAVALCVVMAQAGMFVPATDVTLAPYLNVFTRIQSRDDIYRGQSSFMVEVSELRSILRRSDARSLVIGDEVCSGTESVSALAIVGATLLELLKRRATFLFATHLHELASLPELQPRFAPAWQSQQSSVDATTSSSSSCSSSSSSVDACQRESHRHTCGTLSVFHLRVHHDVRSGTLTYDRRLCPGQGPTVYGLEVCKALDMGTEFIDVAHSIRKSVLRLSKGVLNDRARGSRYNARVVVDVCGACKRNPAEEVHHIRRQAEADADGYIDFYHKNVAYNLIPLCGDCHARTHTGDLKIEGYIQTSAGIVVQGERKEPRKKSTEE